MKTGLTPFSSPKCWNFLHLANQQNTAVCTAHKWLKMFPRYAFSEPKMRQNAFAFGTPHISVLDFGKERKEKRKRRKRKEEDGNRPQEKFWLQLWQRCYAVSWQGVVPAVPANAATREHLCILNSSRSSSSRRSRNAHTAPQVDAARPPCRVRLASSTTPQPISVIHWGCIVKKTRKYCGFCWKHHAFSHHVIVAI